MPVAGPRTYHPAFGWYLAQLLKESGDSNWPALRSEIRCFLDLWLKSGVEALPRPLAETPAGVFDKSDLELFKDRSETFFFSLCCIVVSVGAVLRAHGSMGRCLEPNHGNISLE